MLKKSFQLSKSESGSFKYCGCNIVTLENGNIRLDKNEYSDKLEEIKIVEGGDDSRKLTPLEQRSLRGKIGEILWISLMSRPDLAFDTNRLASEVPKATVKTLKELNQVIRKAKGRHGEIMFSKLGEINDLAIKLYTDASYNNIDNQTRSTEGRVVLAENIKTGRVCVLSWKTKKIARVCRSVKSAETRSLDDGLDDAVHMARIIKEVYLGSIDLKNPDQIPVTAKTDSKSLWENLNNTRQCEEKMLRCTIAGIKELVSLGFVSEIGWVSTEKQLADCLTKKGSANKADWLLTVARNNEL